MVIFIKILFKYQVNRMKIDDFIKSAYVDLKRETAVWHGHITCGEVSISSAEWFSMYALHKMQTRTTYDKHTYYVRCRSLNPDFHFKSAG